MVAISKLYFVKSDISGRIFSHHCHVRVQAIGRANAHKTSPNGPLIERIVTHPLSSTNIFDWYHWVPLGNLISQLSIFARSFFQISSVSKITENKRKL